MHARRIISIFGCVLLCIIGERSLNVYVYTPNSKPHPAIFGHRHPWNQTMRDGSMDLANWMSQLPKTVANKTLNELAIPGTHNSFTYTLDPTSEVGPDVPSLVVKLLGPLAKGIVYNWSVTQSQTFDEQLDSGIRYFDMRVASRSGASDIYFLHGLYGDKVEHGLKEINRFLCQHKKEIVLLEIRCFYDMYEEHHKSLIDSIQRVFRGKLCQYVGVENLTLTWMWDTDVQVIVLYNSNTTEGVHKNLYEDYPFLWPTESSIRTKWADTHSVSELIQHLNSYILEDKGSELHVYQGVLSPDETYVFPGRLSGSLKTDLATIAMDAFISWLKEQVAGPMGTQENRLDETILMSTNDIAFTAGIKKLRNQYPSLSGPLSEGWSHNSFTYQLDPSSGTGPKIPQTIKLFGTLGKAIMYNWSVTQGQTIYQQLASGIRYCDLRVAVRCDTSEVVFIHGFYGIKVETGLKEINRFLEAHPKEVVIIDFNQFYNMTEVNHRTLIDIIQRVFGNKLCRNVGMRDLTLDLLWGNNLQVVVVYKNKIANEYPILWPSKTSITSRWADTHNVPDLIHYFNSYLLEEKEPRFYVYQALLAPDVAYILGHLSGSLKSNLAGKAMAVFLSWVKDKPPGSLGVNICIADFTDIFGDEFVEGVIKLNF